MSIRLSYIYVTKNKLEFVNVSLPELIHNRGEDEEIIVVDGNSTDGAQGYLEGLKESGSIDILISDNDINESHAINKGIFVAKGDIIKLVSDDDIFFYDSIKECKNFMLENEEVEILFGSTYDVHYQNIESLRFLKSSFEDFMKYRELKFPFAFCGLSLMFRKDVLSKFGLFSTLTFAPDTEFSLRVTKLKANITYFNNPLCIRVENPSSNFSFETAYKFEYEGAFILYSLKISSITSFVFFNLKFYFKALIRRLIFRKARIAGKSDRVFKVDRMFYANVTEEVKKDFNSYIASSELFIRSTTLNS